MSIIVLAVLSLSVVLVYRYGHVIAQYLAQFFSISADTAALPPPKRGTFHDLFFNTVFLLLGYVAKCDGHVHVVEVRLTETYMDKMGLKEPRKTEAMKLFKEGSQLKISLDEQLQEFLDLVKKMPDLTEILLVYLVNLARIDGILYPSEIATLQSVGKTLGFSSYAYDHLLKMIASQHKFTEQTAQKNSQRKPDADKSAPYDTGDSDELTTAYEALGVAASVSDAELKDAYRKKMSQYHPDKLAGQGVPDFMIKASTEQFQKIRAAYEYIQKFRG
ncbi:MAG TPA: co-chaperone DjlA [Cellvibrionaceae bacterium]